MGKEIIKHSFEFEGGLTIDLLIRVEKQGITELHKRTFKPIGCPAFYEYYCGDYYLNSFDGSHNKDYSLDELIKTIDENGHHDYQKCFWDHY